MTAIAMIATPVEAAADPADLVAVDPADLVAAVVADADHPLSKSAGEGRRYLSRDA